MIGKNYKAFADTDEALLFNINTITTIKTGEEPVYSNNGKYEFCRLSFLLKNASSIFKEQSMMSYEMKFLRYAILCWRRHNILEDKRRPSK